MDDRSHRAVQRPPGAVEVRTQLARLCASAQLAPADRLVRLLRFVVEQTLAGEGGPLKEARIGLEVFGRPPGTYDPATDPIVRVQMGRLRAKLKAYYEGEGAADPVRIDIPVGGYVPTFTRVRRPAASTSVEDGDYTRLAVLPILDMGREPDGQYFCDGLTDELIFRLAQLPGLRVVARTSSFLFREAGRDIRDVGRYLGVQRVLEGSLRKSGSRIRVTVQLIGVEDGCHLWSERYEGELDDLFAIHERIATAVQLALAPHFRGDRAGRTPHPAIEPYNHYLQGRFLWKQRTEAGLRAALRHFESATGLDAAFARAHAGIADCHLLLGLSGAEAPSGAMARAAAAATTALHLDPALAEAHASLGAVQNCYQWAFAEAAASYDRALRLDPSYATAFHWRGLFGESAAGAHDAAIGTLERAVELDPLALPILADLGLVYAFRGDGASARACCQRALELDPHFHRPFWFLGLIAAWEALYEFAEQALRQGLELCQGAAFRSRLLGALGFVYGCLGRRAAADDIRQELVQIGRASYLSAFELAQVDVGLGELERALTQLEAAVDQREPFVVFLPVWPGFHRLRDQPRFRRLLARVRHRT